MTTRHRLANVLSGELVALLDAYVEELVEKKIAERVTDDRPPWLTLEQAALRLSCTVDAVRMRARRGRLVSRRDGRRVYVSRDSVDRIA